MRGRVLNEADLRRKAREIANRFTTMDDGLIPDDNDLFFDEPVADPAEDVELPEMDEAERRWQARKLLNPLNEELEDEQVSQTRLEESAALFDVWVSGILDDTPKRNGAAVKQQFLEARKLIRKTWRV